jgi:mercuric ion transport protein
MVRRNFADFTTSSFLGSTEPKQGADLFERKTELARPSYEYEDTQVRRTVHTTPARGSRRRGQHLGPLIVAYGFDVHATPPGKFSNRKRLRSRSCDCRHEKSLDPVVATGCILKPWRSTDKGFWQRAVLSARLRHRPAAFCCCILPLILFGLGVSGAWIGNLTRLAPYQPCFIAATLGFLGTGYWLLRCNARRQCTESEACARPLPNRLVKAALVVAAVLVLAAISFDFIAPLLLSS